MARLRTNNVFGTTTNNPLASGGTSLSSAGLANLVAVTGSDYAVVTLDPNRVHGAPEIVYVTAHTAANSSGTILRGQEGTAARSHPAGTFWVHGATALDLKRAWDPPACHVFNSAALNVAHNTEVFLTFNSERYDTDGMHSTSVNTDRITFNTPGIYEVTAGVDITANTTGIRYPFFQLNGTTALGYEISAAPSVGSMAFMVSTRWKFAAGDYVRIGVYQSSGITLQVLRTGLASPEFSAIWLGSGD